MKHILPPEKELKTIDETLKNGERKVLWLSVVSLVLFLAIVVCYANEKSVKKEKETAYKSLATAGLHISHNYKKESPKHELQAGFTVY